MIEAERVYRCLECGELRHWHEVRFNSQGNTTDRCPYCKELLPGKEETRRIRIVKGIEREEPHADEEPDMVVEGAEVYFGVQTRGEAAAEVEREEWGEFLDPS